MKRKPKKEKLRRNDLCPCRSGEKYKKCCYMDDEEKKKPVPVRAIPLEVIAKAQSIFAEHERQEKERLARFGDIRPQITMGFGGYRHVVVGGALHWGKNWKFFPDFLNDFVPAKFGKEWFEAEIAKPENDRHPVMQWRIGAYNYMNAQQPQADGTFIAAPNGYMAAYLYFAYDLYTVADNGGLDDLLLERLKNRDLFQGARHELFAEATCLRAGFTIEHENEKDRAKRHAEFTARHKTTRQMLSVEAKSKHRAGVLAMQGTPQPHEKLSLRFGQLLNDAIAKNPPHPLVIFIDTNLPTKAADKVYVPASMNPFAPSRIMTKLLDLVRKEHGGVDPYAVLVFTNHPYHYGTPDELDLRKQLLSVLRPQDVEHPDAIIKLHEAANLYGNIPNEFPKQTK
jgi:SEC-C motif